ncbi:MAG: hypothetical protein CVV45_07340 [Spirochaetae bacterium HGW-Spirochaetae-10]|nr:MAG: hypothetical protein CVV45_07340 [Spirochaetae bacterium HGW-Spirochaetae-10]
MFLIYRTFEEFRKHPETVELNPDEVQHLKARRIEPDTEIVVCDGRGRTAPALLLRESSGRKEQWSCRPDYTRQEFVDAPERIVYCALPKGSRVDLILEKGTELGMTRFVPVEFERSVRETYSQERAERLAMQAAGQSRRRYIPVFEQPIGLEELLSRIEGSAEACMFLLLDPLGRAAVDLLPRKRDAERTIRSHAIVVGPEGGITDLERIAMLEKGALPVALSDGILRIETAVLAGLSYLNLLQA